MMTLAAVGNHLWQSTLFAAAVGLAALALRRNSASVRHTLWLAASVKFLVPFGMIVALVGAAGVRTSVPVARQDMTATIDAVSQPFVSLTLEPAVAPSLDRIGLVPRRLDWLAAGVWIGGSLTILGLWAIRWGRIAAIVRAGTPIADGRIVDALRQLEHRAGVTRPIALIASDGPLEPGVFGVWRPKLLWPRAIETHLSQAQLVTILAHEVAHVRRRDNLAAAVQTLVEALVWFHPVVWWIGARLIEERECACDEHVLQSGGERELYASTILTACRVYLEAPHACLAGVTGSDLKKRIERIMNGTTARRLTAGSKLLLAIAAFAVLTVPIAAGIVNTPRLRAQAPVRNEKLPEFEVASIKPNKSGPGPVQIQTNPGGRFSATNITLRNLIQYAYRLQAFQLTGGPDWINADRFDIVAKGDDSIDMFSAEQAGKPSRTQLMLQALLADRFKLAVRSETREMPMYALVVARSDGRLGEALHKSSVDCSADGRGQNVDKTPPPPPSAGSCGIRLGIGTLTVNGATLPQFANTLSGLLDRTVVDRTSLAGTFEAALKWTPDESTPGLQKKAAFVPTVDPNGPSIFTALQEQLGLKLDSIKGPVDVLIVVGARQPAAN